MINICCGKPMFKYYLLLKARFGLGFFALILAAVASAAEDKRFSELSAAAESAMAEFKVPGLAIGVIDGNNQYVVGLGITNQDVPQSVDADTLFMIGSISKTFTATAMMALVEKGEVKLDTPVTSVLPDFRVADAQATQQATIVDLFQHRTGWLGDHFDDNGQGEDALKRTMLQLRYLPQVTPFGEVWSYNNVNYQIAGRALEVLTGQSYEAHINSTLLKPLGMNNSGFDVRQLLGMKLAIGHAGVFDGDDSPKVKHVPLFSSIYAAGGLRASVTDLMRYARFQLDGKDANGGRLLSKKSLKMMQDKLVTGAMDTWTGIGWFVEDVGGVTTVYHAGRWVGANAKFLMVPEKNFAIAVLTNSDRGAEVYNQVIAKALKDYLGVVRKPDNSLPFDREKLKDFEGTFEGNLEDFYFYFKGESFLVERLYKSTGNSGVVFDPLPPMHVDLIGSDRIRIADGPNQGSVGELIRDKKGVAQYLRMQSRLFKRKAM